MKEIHSILKKPFVSFGKAFTGFLTIVRLSVLCTAKIEQPLRPALNLIFYHFNCARRVLKSQHSLS